VTAVFLGRASLRSVLVPIGLMGAAVALRALLTWLAELGSHLCSASLKSDLRQRLLERVLGLGPAFLSGERTGELATTAGTGLDALDGYYGRYLPQLALGALVPVMLVVWLARVDLLSAATLAITVPLVPVFMWLVGVTAQARARRRWQTLSLLGAHFLDVVEGLPTLKLFGRSHAQARTIRRVTDDYRAASMGTLRLAFLSALVLELATTVSIALVAVGVGLRLTAGGLGLQAGLTVLLLVPEVYLPLRQVGAQFHGSADALAAAERVFTVLDAPAPGLARGHTADLPDLCRAPVCFEDVSFSHPGRPGLVLDRVSFELRPGERVALVGPSGSGKSTVLGLLLGFVRPGSGRITVGGIDLREVAPESWRGRLAWLPQQPHLFHGSIAENVRLAARIGDDAIRSALERTGLGPWIDSLPEGMETQVGERGGRLSGGQRQRVALARALVRDAPLLLLDEPTVNLDAGSSRLVGRVLESLPADRSALWVVHDPALARRAHRVLRLEGGRLLEAPAALTAGADR
jgi:thiol reductant ABC exporter CydD subunit